MNAENVAENGFIKSISLVFQLLLSEAKIS